MSKRKILICASLFSWAISFSQNSQPIINQKKTNNYSPAPVLLSINSDETIGDNDYKLKCYPKLLNKMSQRFLDEKQIPFTKNKNGTISFRTDTLDKMCYITLSKRSIFDGTETYVDILDLYLAEPGDNILLTIKKDSFYLKEINKNLRVIKNDAYYAKIYFFADYSISFSGHGSAKYSCRYEMDRTTSSYSPLINSTISRNVYQAECDSVERKALSIISKYRSRINKLPFAILKYDYIGRLEQSYYNSLQSVYKSLFKDGSFINQSKNDFKRAIFARSPDPSDDIISISVYYSSLVIDRQKLITLIDDKDISETFYSLKNHYKGEIRDKLLTIYLIDNYLHLKNWEILLGYAEVIVKTPFYVAQLNELSDRMVQGKKAYNFSLPNISGKMVSFEDFKGKVVFIDFWFKSCGACVSYYMNQLTQVEKEFKGNPEVVFITINIDLNKNQWLDAVYDKQHTSLDAINLFTEGLGYDHPVVKYYRVAGCPRPLLINKNGEIFSSSSSDLENAQKLSSLIRTLLTSKS